MHKVIIKKQRKPCKVAHSQASAANRNRLVKGQASLLLYQKLELPYKAKMKEVILLKVRVLTITSVTSNNKEVPQIRIQGLWLEKLGFKAGKKMIIAESYGKLVLRRVSFTEE